MFRDEESHARCVDAWLDRADKGLTPAELVSLFERATSALWQRARLTLGEVTLTAIVDRVLYTASEKYPLLATLKLDDSGIHFDELRNRGAAESDHLREVIRFVLVELLTVLGNLTDQILTPALHSELSTVALEEPRRERRAKPLTDNPGSTDRGDDGGKDAKS